jgi:hypothetical protein
LVKLHQTDSDLYNFFKERTAAIAAGVSRTVDTSRLDEPKQSNLLALVTFLRLICNHGKDLLPSSASAAWDARDRTSVDWQLMQHWRKKCDVCNAVVDSNESISRSSSALRCDYILCGHCACQGGSNSTEFSCLKCVQERDPHLSGRANDSVRPSAKVDALIKNLHAEQGSGRSQDRSCVTKRYATLYHFALCLRFVNAFQCGIQLLDQNA